MLMPHILAGAALATIVPASTPGRVGAFVLGVASHYALDAVPHWERLFGPHYNDQMPKDYLLWPDHIIIQGALDMFVGLLLLRYFSFAAPSSFALGIFLGGLGAALPDVLDNTPWWKHLTKKLPLWKSIESLHRMVHMSYKKQRRLPQIMGLATQLATASIALVVLFQFSR